MEARRSAGPNKGMRAGTAWPASGTGFFSRLRRKKTSPEHPSNNTAGSETAHLTVNNVASVAISQTRSSADRTPALPGSEDVTVASLADGRVQDGCRDSLRAAECATNGLLNTKPSPAEPRPINRLIGRINRNHRHSWAGPATTDSCYIALSETETDLADIPEDGTEQLLRRTRPWSTVRPLAQADPILHRSASTRSHAMSAQVAPPLRKKASFRERITLRLRPSIAHLPPPPPPPLNLDPRPRTAYVPKHAASDFSRLAVSPRPDIRYSSEQPREPIEMVESALSSPASSMPSTVDERTPVQRKRLSPPLQTLQENVLGPLDDQTSRKVVPAPIVLPARQLSQSRRNKSQSYKRAVQPEEISEVRAPASERADLLDVRTQVESTDMRPRPSTAAPATDEAKVPMSDFEKFIARAEAEDRAQREQILRHLALRSAAMPPAPVRPSPHQQYAIGRPGTAQNATAGGGSKTSRSGSNQDSGYDAGLVTTSSKNEDEPGMDRRDRRRSREIPEASRLTTAHVYTVQSQQQSSSKTLRRQSSIVARIADYVRPAPKQTGREQAACRPTNNVARRSFGRRPAIATVAEV